MKKVILAPSSKGRRQLLKQLGINAQIRPSYFNESLYKSKKLPPHQLVKCLSSQKAKAVAVKERNAIIIAADTVVVLKNKILGKPKTAAKAKKMLRQISGQKISTITGYTIIDAPKNKCVTRSVETKAYIKKLTSREISDYVKTNEPLDKAGAFGIQGRGAFIIRKIEGDYYNIIGLPLFSIVEALKKFGVHLL